MIQLDMFLALSAHKEISMDSMNLLMLCDNEILTEIQALSFTQRWIPVHLYIWNIQPLCDALFWIRQSHYLTQMAVWSSTRRLLLASHIFFFQFSLLLTKLQLFLWNLIFLLLKDWDILFLINISKHFLKAKLYNICHCTSKQQI